MYDAEKQKGCRDGTFFTSVIPKNNIRNKIVPLPFETNHFLIER